MLCEKTDNEASGSTEALAATLIKYNSKKHRNNGKYSNTKNRVTKKHNHTFTNPLSLPPTTTDLPTHKVVCFFVIAQL